MVNDIFGGNRVEQPHIVSIIPEQYQWQQDTYIYIYTVYIHPSIHPSNHNRQPLGVLCSSYSNNINGQMILQVRTIWWSDIVGQPIVQRRMLDCFASSMLLVQYFEINPHVIPKKMKRCLCFKIHGISHISPYDSRWILRFQSFFFDVCWLNPVDLEESPCLYVWCWQIPSLEKLLSTNLVRSWWMLDRFHKFNHLENHYA